MNVYLFYWKTLTITTTPAVLNVFAVADAVSQYLAASTGLHQAMAVLHFCVSSHHFHDKKRICSNNYLSA